MCVSGRKDKGHQDPLRGGGGALGSGWEAPWRDAVGQRHRLGVGWGELDARILPVPLPKLGVDCLGLGAPLVAALGPGGQPGNCQDRPSEGCARRPPPHDRYSITGLRVSPAYSLQVPASSPLPLSDPNIARLKLTFNR